METVAQLRQRMPDLPLSTENLDLYSSDLYYEAAFRPLAVVSPTTVPQVQDLVRHARELGLSLSARGAGLSYSAGYLPANGQTVTVDFTRMDRVVEVNAQDRYVTVEPGVTWMQLREVLQPLGLTTPFWGTFSGRHATVGASLSQGAKFFGSASRGTSAESVLVLKVVTGTGDLVVTGSAASTVGVAPFFRSYGPDLAGLFLGDSGAFGFKVEITLQLIPIAGAIGTCAFSFEDPEAQMNVMGQVGAEMLATECQGTDPFTARARMAGEGLGHDLRTAFEVAKGSGGILKGGYNALALALSGRRFISGIGYLMNCVTEGRDSREARSRVARISQLATRGGGRAVPASVSRVLRSIPFPAMNSLLTASGKRVNWLHTMVPNSLGADCFRITEAIFERNEAAMKAHRIDRGYLLSTHGPTAVGVETMIRWPDRSHPIHVEYLSDAERAKIKLRGSNLEAAGVVASISNEVMDAWRSLGGVHMQIGRKYPYFETRLPETAALLRNLKDTLDPDGIINPGNTLPLSGSENR